MRAAWLACAVLGLAFVSARSEDAATALGASAPQLSPFKAGTLETGEQAIARLSADQLLALGNQEGFFFSYIMPRERIEVADNPENDKNLIDLALTAWGRDEIKGTVDRKLWNAYWARANELFVEPAALEELARHNVTVLSYADPAFFSNWGFSSTAGGILNPKQYGEAVSKFAEGLKRYPPGFFQAPLAVELYASGRMLSGHCGQASDDNQFSGLRLAIMCPADIGSVMHHEIGHIVIPVKLAEKLDEEIYGGLVRGARFISKPATNTEEQAHSFLPNCIQSWDDREPQGAENAAEDFATIVDNLQCGRRDQVLAKARENSFVRRKLEKIVEIYAARGYDVSSWRL